MTSTQMPTRLAMPQPFASGANATRATIGSVSGNSVNYPDGFPAVYSSPASEGGKYVSRGEMNAIGNMASNDLHYFKCGGLNTFDAAFAAAVGGYPKGAVVEVASLNDYSLKFYVSLIDNNLTDPAEVGNDLVHWAVLNYDTAKAEEFNKIVSIGELGINAKVNNLDLAEDGDITIGVFSVDSFFYSPYAGALLFSLSPDLPFYKTTHTVTLATRGVDQYGMLGCGLLIRDVGTSLPTEALTDPTSPANWGDWKALWNWSTMRFTDIQNSTQQTNYATAPNFISLQAGHYYAIRAFLGADGTSRLTSSTTSSYTYTVSSWSSYAMTFSLSVMRFKGG